MKTKRILGVLLALVMLAGLVPVVSVPARAADPIDISDAVINIDPTKQPEFFSNGFNAGGSMDNPVDVVIDSVTLNGKVLHEGTDYVIKEGGSKSAATKSDMTQKLVIQGVGAYTGTAEAEWQPKKAAATPDWFYFHKWTTTVGDYNFGIKPYAVDDDGKVTAGGLELCTGGGMIGNNWTHTSYSYYSNVSALTGVDENHPRHYLFKLDGDNANGKYWKVGSYTVSYAKDDATVKRPWEAAGIYDVTFHIDGTNEWVLDTCDVTFENALKVVDAGSRTNINTLTVTIEPFTHTGGANSLYISEADRSHVHFYKDESDITNTLTYGTDWTVLPSTWVREESRWVPIYGIGDYYYGVIWAEMPAVRAAITEAAFAPASIAAKTHTYDGQPVTVTPERRSDSYTNVLDGLTVKYAPKGTSVDSTAWTATPPSNAGVYDVKLTLPEDTISFLAGSLVLKENITIDKATWNAPDINVTVPEEGTSDDGITVRLPAPPPGLTAVDHSNEDYAKIPSTQLDPDENTLWFSASAQSVGTTATATVNYGGTNSNYKPFDQKIICTWSDDTAANVNVAQVAVSYTLNGSEVRVMATKTSGGYKLTDPIPGAAEDIEVFVTPVDGSAAVSGINQISDAGVKIVGFTVTNGADSKDYTLAFTVLQQYTVSFDVNGGTGAMDTVSFDGDPQSYEYKLPSKPSDVTAPAGSTFAGYRLKGSTDTTIYRGYYDKCTLYGDNPNVTFELVWRRSLANAVVTCAPGDQAIADGDDKSVVITSVYWSDGAGNLIELKKDTDYTIKSGDTASGTDPQTLTIEGIGNYTGTATAIWHLQNKEGLRELVINQGPNKDTYLAGERFDPDGMEVAAVDNLDGGWVLDLADCDIRPTGPLAYGDVAVFVSYTEKGVTKTIEVPIKVKPGVHTVTFNANGGSVTLTSADTDEDGKLASLPVPTRDGYYFAGWFTASEGGEAVTLETIFPENTELFAHWTVKTPSGPTGGYVTPTTHDCPSKKFNDVDANAWYHEYVDYVVENGLMNGVSADKFAPNATTTRAMVVTILYRLEGEPAVSGENKFDDVQSGKWYTDAVKWADANGIAGGYGNGKFGINDNITREQLAVMLYRYAKYKGYDVSVGKDTNILSYKDAKDVSAWAMEAMQWAVGAGIIKGRSADTLVPKGTATRAEIAAMLTRFIENVK